MIDQCSTIKFIVTVSRLLIDMRILMSCPVCSDRDAAEATAGPVSTAAPATADGHAAQHRRRHTDVIQLDATHRPASHDARQCHTHTHTASYEQPGR